MSATLWIDEGQGKAVELGGTIQFYRYFAEMANIAGDSFFEEWPDLSGIATQVERQEDADPDWLNDLRTESSLFLKVHGGKLSTGCKGLLKVLSTVGG